MDEIIEYKHPRISGFGGKKVMVHVDFVGAMDLFCGLLEIHNLTAIITSSFRPDSNFLKGAIVTPAEKGNHFVGHALDVNFKDSSGVYWNSKNLDTPTGDMKAFIGGWVDAGMRWGQAFKKPDDVHFDSGLNIRNPDRWNEIYNSLHLPI